MIEKKEFTGSDLVDLLIKANYSEYGWKDNYISCDENSILVTKNVVVKGDLLLSNINISKKLKLSCDFEGSVTCDDGKSKFKSLEFQTTIVDTLYLKKIEAEELRFDLGKDVKYLNLENAGGEVFLRLDWTGSLSMKHCSISKLQIEDSTIHSNGKLAIYNSHFGNFFVERVSNDGQITIVNCRHDFDEFSSMGYFSLQDSSLGKIIFNRFEFDSFKSMSIKGTNLSEMESYITHLPTDSKYGFDSSDFELFGTLAVAMTKIGNKDRAASYNVSRLIYFRLFLKRWYPGYYSQRIVLSINRFSSLYGTSWVLPIIWIFVFGFIFFYPYFISLSPNIQATWPWYGDWQLFGNFIGSFFQFLWPTHSFKFLSETPDGWAFLDGIHRVINGYLIYQLVTAFRRMGTP